MSADPIRFLSAILVASALAGCTSAGSGEGGTASSADGAVPRPSATTAERPEGPRPFDPATAALDLTKPDGAACRAVIDSGIRGNLALMSQVAAVLAIGALDASTTDGQLQTRLDGIKPQLKELSQRVVWLPEASEVLVGEQLARQSPRTEYKPAKGRPQTFVDTVVKPTFEAFRTYAEKTLHSDQKFHMVLYVDDLRRSPSMLPGGTLFVPSGMIKTLSGRSTGADQIVAFTFAHEFSHALRRHITKTTQETMVDGLLQAQVFRKSFKGLSLTGDVTNRLSSMFDLSKSTVDAAVNKVCGTEKWRTDFAQGQELEADVCGTLLISKLQIPGKHYDALAGLKGYRDIMASLPATTPPAGDKGGCATVETHPDVAQREQNIATYQRTLTTGK